MILKNKKSTDSVQTKLEQSHIISRAPNYKDLLNPIHFLSLGLGSGLLKPAPGTWGTLAALPLWLLLAEVSPALYVVIILLTFSLGIYFCGYTAKALGTHDHSSIVWDEFVGLWIALFLVPMTWTGIILAFIFFRLFDIWKPWPIAYFDKHMHGGLGIMIDDVIAGVFACCCTHLILQLLPLLTL